MPVVRSVVRGTWERADAGSVCRTHRGYFEVRRVISGTCWLNIGDSYGAGGGKQVLQKRNASHGLEGHRQKTPGIASKQLVGIPWRLAFALQNDGWYLRQEIIWEKPACMPESVSDCPYRSHEQIFAGEVRGVL